jgi:transcription antitermination factor NusG
MNRNRRRTAWSRRCSIGILQFGRQLKVGGPVRLLAGPFADQLAILDDLDETGRVRVLLDLLGRKVPVATDCNNLLPIEEART